MRFYQIFNKGLFFPCHKGYQLLTLSLISSFLLSNVSTLVKARPITYETRRDDGSFCLLFIIFRFPHDVTVSRLLGCRRGGGRRRGCVEGVEGWSYLLTLPGRKRVILTPHILQTTLSSGFPAATNIT